jgi:hypothetical protein
MTRFNDAYEVLDYLADKNGMFNMIRDEFLNKDSTIAELRSEIDTLALTILDLLGV